MPNEENPTTVSGNQMYRSGHFMSNRLIITGSPTSLDNFETEVKSNSQLSSLLNLAATPTVAHPAPAPVLIFDKASESWVETELALPQLATVALGSDQLPNVLHQHYHQHLQAQGVGIRRYTIAASWDAPETVKKLRGLLDAHPDNELKRLNVFLEHIACCRTQDPGGGSPDLREYARAATTATAADFQKQPCFERIGAVPLGNWQHIGDNTTVVILDTAPHHQYLDPAAVDYFIDMAGPNNEFPPLQKLPFNPYQPCADLPQTRRKLPKLDGDYNLRATKLEPYHGLMAAGLIKYLAPQTTIILLQVLNNRGEVAGSTLASALDYITYLRESQITANGQRLISDNYVINLSLGIQRCTTEMVEACYLLEACERACVQGALLVCAAGNDSYEGHPQNPQEPAAYGYFNDTPNTNMQVIAVAATSDKPNAYAFFSNRGNLAAPGYDILLDVGANYQHDPARQHDLTRYLYWSGTSFATPQVSAACALLLNAGVPPNEVKQILWNSVSVPGNWNQVPEVHLGRALEKYDLATATLLAS